MMNKAITVLVALLTLLAIASGLSKVMLTEQEVDFFTRFGFTSTMIIGFGAAQLVGAVLLPFQQTRLIGAATVASTFVVSLVILLADSNTLMSAITVVAIVLLLAVMVHSWLAGSKDEQV